MGISIFKKKRFTQLTEISYDYIQTQLSRYQVNYVTSFSSQYPSLLKTIYDYPLYYFIVEIYIYYHLRIL